MSETSDRPPLLPLSAALQAGFELTTRKMWLLILPLLLDGYLWLGPRLSVRPLLLWTIEQLQNTAPPAGTSNPATIEMLQEFGGIYNLFAQLSPPFMGIPILFKGMEFDNMPLPAAVIEIDSWGMFVLLYGLFSAIGLLAGAFYFAQVAAAVQQPDQSGFWRRLPVRLLHVLGIALLLLGLCAILALPTMFVAALTAIVSAWLAQLVIAAAIVLFITAAVFLFFSLHGILYGNQPFWRAAYDSLRIVRENTHLTLWLIVLLVGLSFLLDTVWRAVENGSWFTIVPIFAHAFVQTSLFVSSRLSLHRPSQPPAGQRTPHSDLAFSAIRS